MASGRLVAVLLGLCILCQGTCATVLGKPEFYAPSSALVGSKEDVQCGVLDSPEGVPILYQLYVNDNWERAIGEYTSLAGETANFPLIMTSSYDGHIVCKASVQNNTAVQSTFSNRHLLRVIELVSKPEISFAVVKDGDVYYANVTCLLVQGTPPITFTLNSSTELFGRETATHELNATFIVPIVLDQRADTVRCHADNGGRPAQSDELSLDVVGVGGKVTMRYDYDMTPYFQVVGLRMYCSVERGTFPRYRWFLNGSRLERRSPSHWIVQPDQSILLLSVSPSSAGLFRCEASDSFDDGNTTRASSEELLINKDVLNRVPTEMVAVVFTCFLFLIALVTACCFYGVVYRRKLFSNANVVNEEEAAEMDSRTDEFDELVDDMDVVRAARIDDSDQGEVESTDDWLQIEEALKLTCMDEEVPLSDP